MVQDFVKMSKTMKTVARGASPGPMPPSARRLSDGAMVNPYRGQWTVDLAAQCGFLPVVEDTRPDEPDGFRAERGPLVVEATRVRETWVLKKVK